MAAGAIRLHDAKTCAGRGLAFSPFGVQEGLDEDKLTSGSKFLKLTALKYLGFSPCEFFMLQRNPTETITQDALTELKQLAEEKWLPIDGIVVAYNDISFSRQCGRTGHHYKDGLAFKYEDGLHETILRGIEWNPSRSGELSPVAMFDSVEIDGCDVSRASLHNLTFIKELELMPGCRILVSKRNLIIPHVEENLERGKFNGFAIRLRDALEAVGVPVSMHRVHGGGHGFETPHIAHGGGHGFEVPRINPVVVVFLVDFLTRRKGAKQ
jgi:DNA ligase (NAD+)